MADTLTAVQHPDGYYPTYLRRTALGADRDALGTVDYGGLWANCMSYSAEMLMKLGNHIHER